MSGPSLARLSPEGTSLVSLPLDREGGLVISHQSPRLSMESFSLLSQS